MRLVRDGKVEQWVFYKESGELIGNRVRVICKPGSQGILGFSGVIAVSELKGTAWTVYVHKRGRLQRIYYGDYASAGRSNQCVLEAEPEWGTYREEGSMGPESVMSMPSCHGGGGGGPPGQPDEWVEGEDGKHIPVYHLKEVVYTAHRKKPHRSPAPTHSSSDIGGGGHSEEEGWWSGRPWAGHKGQGQEKTPMSWGR